MSRCCRVLQVSLVFDVRVRVCAGCVLYKVCIYLYIYMEYIYGIYIYIWNIHIYIWNIYIYQKGR